MKQKLFFKLILPLLALSIFTLPALAQNDLGLPEVHSAGPETKSTQEITLNFVKTVLLFLALLAIVVILRGGFQMFAAAGNDERIHMGLRVALGGLAGLVILLSAYGITCWLT